MAKRKVNVFFLSVILAILFFCGACALYQQPPQSNMESGNQMTLKK